MPTSSPNDMAGYILGDWHANAHPLLHQHRAVDTHWIVQAAFEQAASQPATSQSATSQMTTTESLTAQSVTAQPDISQPAPNTPSLTLKREDTRQLIKAFFEWRRETERPVSQRDAQKRVTRVLQSLNECHHLTAMLPPTKVRPHRDTVMPVQGQTLVRAEQVIALDGPLEAWARDIDTLDGWLLLLAVRLMTRIAMGHAVLLGTLSQLTRLHVDDQCLLIPAYPGAELASSAHYRLTLPSAVWRPLRAVLTRWPGPADQWLFAAKQSLASDALKDRECALTQRLKQVTRACLKSLQHHPRSDAWQALSSWPTLCQASRYVPVLQGIPAVYATLLSAYPLPTDSPVSLRVDHVGDRFLRLERSMPPASDEASPLPSPGPETQPPGVRTVDTTHLPVDWPRQIKRRLTQFLNAAQRLTPSNTVHAQKHEHAMQQLLTEYEAHLVALLPTAGSYAQWLLHWAYHLLRAQKHTISTVKTYMSRLTPLPLMLNEGTLYLGDWDEEFIEELQADTLNEMAWKSATQTAFQQTYRQFLRFCQSNGLLEDVDLPPISRHHAVSTLRTNIMTPAHFHSLWHGLTQGAKAGETRQMMALVIALGFYGGLRASEILSLTLNDVVIDQDRGTTTCWIEILGGKTPAARRRVGFHVWAPPSVISALGAWVAHRRAAFAKRQRLSDVGLFGPPGNPNAYRRDALITPVIDWMREAVGPGIDFHGLRHAAVSWALLRLHAAQTPGFAETLTHYSHWIFQPQSLEALLVHICGG